MTGRVERVQGLRSSGAAGPHGARATRAAELADALADYEDEVFISEHLDDEEPAAARAER